MMLYTDTFLHIYFGGISSHVVRDLLMNTKVGDPVAYNEELVKVQSLMGTADLFVLKQEHGTNGAVITDETSRFFHGQELVGDYLITAKPFTGLLVYTADCLPVVVYDPVAHVIGIYHAGWKGSAANIASKMLHGMVERYGTDPGMVKVFFGPSAYPCCYRVSADFLDFFDKRWQSAQVFIERDNELFFDLVALNRIQLESCGVLEENLCYDYSMCTIENNAFCSARRDSKNGSTARQVTIASLR